MENNLFRFSSPETAAQVTECGQQIIREMMEAFEKNPIDMKGPDVHDIPDPYLPENYMDFEMFKATVNSLAEQSPKCWRKGQSVFNIVDKIFGVARDVQFLDGIDCFYVDDKIDDFMKAAYEHYWDTIKRIQSAEKNG